MAQAHFALAVLTLASISSVSAWAASMHWSRLTSRCVTNRIASGPNAPARTPRALSRAARSAAPFPAVSRKTTILVSTDSRSIDDSLGVRQRLGQQPRVGVIVCEPRRPLFERDQPCRGQHARLPHSAAHRLAIDARLRHQLRRAHQHRSHRRAQALRQTEHHGVESARQLLHVHAQRHSRVEDARAVANLFGEQVLGRRFAGTDRPQAEWAPAGVHQSVPEGTDGSAASAGSARSLRGTGTICSGNPGAAQRSAGLGHNRFESPGGLWRGPQFEQRSRAAGLGVDQRG